MVVFYHLRFIEFPDGENITHKRSYCPSCNHVLGFLDLVPVLSYIILKGKCKHCKEKISPIYLVLEIATGLIFLVFAISLRMDVSTLNVERAVFFMAQALYIATLLLIAGIDGKHFAIAKRVLLFGLLVKLIYMVYLYILGNNIYGYVMYLSVIIVVLILDKIYSKKVGKGVYAVQILALCAYMNLWLKEDIIIPTIILTLFIIIIKGIPISTKKERKEKKDKNTSISTPIGAYLCISNILMLLISNFI